MRMGTHNWKKRACLLCVCGSAAPCTFFVTHHPQRQLVQNQGAVGGVQLGRDEAREGVRSDRRS